MASTKIRWYIKPDHSEISFKVMHILLSNVKGVFKEFDANIETREEDFTSAEIVFWINPNSLETGDTGRDEHLKSNEFFEVNRYKKITFVSDRFEKTSKEGCYNLWGYLTIKGITNHIKLDVTSKGVIHDEYGNDTAQFNIIGKISRKDWNLSWNDTTDKLGLMGSDEVTISCSLELEKLDDEKFEYESNQVMMDYN